MRVLRTGLKLATLRPKIIVPGGGGAVWRGNEPAGFTAESDRSFVSLNDDPNWGSWVGPGATFVSDATAPKSPNGTVHLNYPAGMTDGGSPETSSIGITNSKDVYLCYYFKYSSNWYGHSTGINKHGYVWLADGTPAFVYEAEAIGNGAMGMRMSLQPGEVIVNPNSDGWYGQNLVPGATVTRGNWMLIEILLTGNTPGTTDGVLDFWMDGVHVAHWTGFQFTTARTDWNLVRIAPVYGGNTGETVPADQYLAFDHYYISRKV